MAIRVGSGLFGVRRAVTVGAVAALAGVGVAPAAQAAPARAMTGASAASAPAASTSAAPTRKRTTPYLALGDSVTAGYQPEKGVAPQGGYVGVVRSGLARRGAPVASTNLACVGETTTMLLLGGGRCTYAAGSQLAQAERFLRANRSTRLITVSVGANDLLACRQGDDVSVSCGIRTAKRAGENLDTTLRRLRKAAPKARIVVLEYYNPYLALKLDGQRLAAINSTLGQQRLNSEIGRVAARRGAKVARVSTAFGSTDTRRTSVPGRGTLPRNLANICSWTWMCSKGDIHPNDTGYGVIGRAVLDRL